MIYDSTEAYRASWTSGVLVKTLDPGMAGIALDHELWLIFLENDGKTHHDATGFGDLSTSTKHILKVADKSERSIF